MESEALFECCSPNGNVFAIVEQDDQTAYFYLYGDKSTDFGVRSCWVRNLRPAPETLDVSAMRDGLSPMLPRQFCRHPDGSSPLQADSLEVVWTEEGDAAALYEREELLAIIPSWSGQKGFYGYARDCQGEGPLCWELSQPKVNAQYQRFEKARDYWKLWDEQPGPWEKFRTEMCDAIEKRVGKHSNYYAIDGGKWPPKGLLRIPQSDSVILVTIGMSLRPQPKVESFYEDPSPHRRIELGISLDSGLEEKAIMSVAQYVSGQTRYPWSFYTFLGHGHTIPSDVFGSLSNNALPFALLQSQPDSAPGIKLPGFRGDPVNLLWMTPIGKREREYAEGTNSTQLATKLRAQGHDWRHTFKRTEVV